MRLQTVFLAAAILFLSGCASTDRTQHQGCSVCCKVPASEYRLLPSEDLPLRRPTWEELRRVQDSGSNIRLCDECIRMRYERQPMS